MNRFSQSLATNITLALTMGLVAVLIMSGWVITYKIRNEIYRTIDQKNKYVLSLQADNAAIPLWNFDTAQLQAIVDNLIKDENTSKATIKSNYGGMNVTAGADTTALEKGDHYKIFRQDIFYDDQGKSLNLGTLIIESDYSKVIDQLNAFVLRLSLFVLALFAVLISTIYIIAKRAIQPVTELSRTLAGTPATGALITESATASRVVEVQQLFNALRKMQENYARYHKDLMAEKEKADSANVAKTLFLANMSHELRTPLNSILGIAKMFLEDKKLDHESMEMIEIMNKAGNSLLSTVNNILDISKIEANAIILETIPFDLKNLIGVLLDTIKPIASSKGLMLAHVYNVDHVPLLEGDPTRLSSILLNLLTNATKYTETGNIRLSVNCAPIDDKNVEVMISIEDTGIGIPEDKIETIFEKFSQADSTITRRYGGTGLGLSITKELVELMKGKIVVKSEVGVGSIFSLSIPFKIANPDSFITSPARKIENFAPTSVPKSSKEASALNVLIAEDHSLNQALIKKITKRLGLDNIQVCENGKLALEAYKSGHYDLILMDCHMPEMNGYEVTQAIREIEKGTDKHTIIIALTADAMPETRSKCLEAGMDEYISKPINTDTLRNLICRWYQLP